jgi:hypothetical protein
MQEYRIAWRGLDLYDSIEQEGMTLTSRACYRIACEIVSLLRGYISGYIPEPSQDDGWASLEFPNLGQRVKCVVSFQDENDYSVTVDCFQGILRSLMGRKPPEIKHETLELVRRALSENPRIEILRKGNAG